MNGRDSSFFLHVFVVLTRRNISHYIILINMCRDAHHLFMSRLTCMITQSTLITEAASCLVHIDVYRSHHCEWIYE